MKDDHLMQDALKLIHFIIKQAGSSSELQKLDQQMYSMLVQTISKFCKHHSSMLKREEIYSLVNLFLKMFCDYADQDRYTTLESFTRSLGGMSRLLYFSTHNKYDYNLRNAIFSQLNKFFSLNSSPAKQASISDLIDLVCAIKDLKLAGIAPEIIDQIVYKTKFVLYKSENLTKIQMSALITSWSFMFHQLNYNFKQVQIIMIQLAEAFVKFSNAQADMYFVCMCAKALSVHHSYLSK